jgi:hypothetical protein
MISKIFQVAGLTLIVIYAMSVGSILYLIGTLLILISSFFVDTI